MREKLFFLWRRSVLDGGSRKFFIFIIKYILVIINLKFN